MTGTPNTNGEQTGQPNATVTPGQGNEEINGASKPGEVSPKPEENNPTATEPGTTAPGNTNQDTQVKPNTDQTATGTQLVLIIKIRNKAILNKITKMLNHQHLEQLIKPVLRLNLVLHLIKTLKLNLIQIKIIHQLMVKTGIKQVKVLK